MGIRAAVFIVACSTAVYCTRTEIGASGGEQDHDRSAIAGTWRLDEAQSTLRTENWHDRLKARSPGAPCLPTLTRPGEPVTYDCRSPYQPPFAGPPNVMGESALATFGHPLLDASPTLTIAVGASSVTIGGELLETRTYATSGKPEKLDVIVHHSARWPSTRPVRIVTQWVGTTLVQEKKSAYSGTAVAMTETYLPSENGEQLFVMIDVLKPVLKPPVKPIRRVYVRSK
jgi:hypothetical protein